MPRIADQTESHAIVGTSFTFTGARIEDLGSTEYTLVTICIDVTGSTSSFADQLLEMLKTALESCKKSPRAENLLVRVVIFSTYVGVQEIHGFKPLHQINPNDYNPFRPDGLTNLFDASFEVIASEVQYGGVLMKNDYLANGIVFIITDGGDNASTHTPRDIATQVAKAQQQELLESLVIILIGINAQNCQSELERFQKEAGITQYMDAGSATRGNLAKLGGFVSNSVSSTSQALGTGGPSQQIAATI